MQSVPPGTFQSNPYVVDTAQGLMNDVVCMCTPCACVGINVCMCTCAFVIYTCVCVCVCVYITYLSTEPFHNKLA